MFHQKAFLCVSHLRNSVSDRLKLSDDGWSSAGIAMATEKISSKSPENLLLETGTIFLRTLTAYLIVCCVLYRDILSSGCSVSSTQEDVGLALFFLIIFSLKTQLATAHQTLRSSQIHQKLKGRKGIYALKIPTDALFWIHKFKLRERGREG